MRHQPADDLAADVVVGVGNATDADIEKFEKFGLSAGVATRVKAPLISEMSPARPGIRRRSTTRATACLWWQDPQSAKVVPSASAGSLKAALRYQRKRKPSPSNVPTEGSNDQLQADIVRLARCRPWMRILREYALPPGTGDDCGPLWRCGLHQHRRASGRTQPVRRWPPLPNGAGPIGGSSQCKPVLPSFR